MPTEHYWFCVLRMALEFKVKFVDSERISLSTRYMYLATYRPRAVIWM